jgi:uncharacterized protein (DUF1330 family)
MSTLAVAQLKNVRLGPEIVEYLARIDDTLAPFGGRFLVHGGPVERLEGEWSGALVIIEFPDRRCAREWYDSAPYRAILPLRADNTQSDLIFIDTVPSEHRATDVLQVAPAAV